MAVFIPISYQRYTWEIKPGSKSYQPGGCERGLTCQDLASILAVLSFRCPWRKPFDDVCLVRIARGVGARPRRPTAVGRASPASLAAAAGPRGYGAQPHFPIWSNSRADSR